jgi:hypothetical protein
MNRKHASIVVAILGGVLLGAFPKQLGGQAGGTQAQAQDSLLLPNERDLAARKKALENDSTDLEGMAKSLTGAEFDAALSIDQKTGQGTMEVDAALWFLGIYDNMQCDADRDIAKAALKNRLGFYSYLLGLEADQVAGHLPYMRLPATVQASVRAKDDLRAAKDKLDEIAALLK